MRWRTMNKVKPNYDRMREPYVHALQHAYWRFANAQKNFYDFTGYSNDGTFFFVNKERLLKDINESSVALEKAQKDLNYFDVWVRIEKVRNGNSMDILYSTEKLCGHDELPTNELLIAIGKQLAAKHDELIFTALDDYGIDRDNIGENVDRIYRARQGDDFEHFFIDGVYGFSIHRFSLVMDEERNRIGGGFEIRYINSMIGMELSEYETSR